jgi:hypothetical protein
MRWGEASDADRALMQQLVAEGRLEFTGGGYVQPDEAITRHEGAVPLQLSSWAWMRVVGVRTPARPLHIPPCGA